MSVVITPHRGILLLNGKVRFVEKTFLYHPTNSTFPASLIGFYSKFPIVHVSNYLQIQQVKIYLRDGSNIKLAGKVELVG